MSAAAANLVTSRIADGWRLCASCHGLNRPNRDACFQCGQPLVGSVDLPAAAARRGRPVSVSARGARRGASGSLRPGTHVDIVAYGLPVSQGSGSAPAPGVFKQENGPALKRWRRKISAAARDVCGDDWVAPNVAVRVTVVVTVPAPAGVTKPAVADSYRDLDKLVRAVGDGLCPRSGFRTVASDMRISTEYAAKTYPSPLGTHPCALARPGVWIRVAADAPPATARIDGHPYLLVPIPDRSPDDNPPHTPSTLVSETP